MTRQDAALEHWTQTLTGLEPERVRHARAVISSWQLEHVREQMLEGTVDAAVAATLLVEAIDLLADRGIPPERLLKKLRHDREVWGTWAEIRAADILSRSIYDGCEVQLEEGRSLGAHADLRFLLPYERTAHSVEVKAVGLSDDEVAFCRRMAPSLRRLAPRHGLSHAHASLAAAEARVPREARLTVSRESRRAARRVPGFPLGLRGAAIVAHGSEASYGRRVNARVLQAVRQLPADDECWVAIFWSNGAPFEVVRAALDWSQVPGHVAGVILVGCGVAFPDRHIHCYSTPIARGSASEVDVVVQSRDEDLEDLAALVLERFQRSSGVRATLLYGANKVIVARVGTTASVGPGATA